VTGCRARCARGPARLPFRVRQPSPALALPPRAQEDFHVKVHPERLKAEAEFMQELRDMGLTGDELREEAMGTRAEYEAQLAELHEVPRPVGVITRDRAGGRAARGAPPCRGDN